MPEPEITAATTRDFLRAFMQRPEAVRAAWLEFVFSIGKNRWKKLDLINPPTEYLEIFGYPDAGISLNFFAECANAKDNSHLTDVLIRFSREHDYEFSYSGWTRAAVGRLALSSEKDAKRFLADYHSVSRLARRNNTKNMAVISTMEELNSKHKKCWIRAIRWAQRYRKNKGNRNATTERLLQEYVSTRVSRCTCLSDEWVAQLFDSAAVVAKEPSRVLRNLIAQNHGISESTLTHFLSAGKRYKDKTSNRGKIPWNN